MTLAKYDAVTKISGPLRGANGYLLGEFSSSVAYGRPPDWLVCWKKTLDNVQYRFLCRELVMDLRPIGGGQVDVDWKPDILFALVETSPPPVIVPPVEPPIEPPVEPPIEPPVEPPQISIKMTITVATGTPITVLDWFEPNIPVEYRGPAGDSIGRTKTGAKGSEFGANSAEAGYNTRGDGNYILDVGDHQFIVPVSGSARFIRLHFERTSTPPADPQVKLASIPMSRTRAEAVLPEAQHAALDKLGLDGLFRIER